MRAFLILAALAAAPAAAQSAYSNPPNPHANDHFAPRADPAPAPHWVFLADKGFDEPAALAAALARLECTYNPRATQRRVNRRTLPGLFDERDLPIYQPYIEAITETGAALRVASRWLNAVSVEASPAQLEAIAALPFVTAVQPVARAKRLEPVETIDPATPASPEAGFYGAAEEQLTQINLIALHDAGFTADGIIIGVLDTGFLRTHDAFNNPAKPLTVIAEYDFVNNDPNTGPEPGDHPDQHKHGTWILGTLAAYLPDTLVGGAFDASFILCKTEDVADEYPAEEDYYVAGLEFIEANGGDVATSSLGYIDWYTQASLNGQTAVTTTAVNIATANGVYCCTAAGNGGHDTNPATSHLIAPADAFEVITCGAVRSTGEPASFSSDGPTADGRVKPELMARGEATWTVSVGSTTGLSQLSGTSLSTPLVASAVACLAQARPTWSVGQMRTMLFETADFFGSPKPDPEFVWGYGILNAHLAYASDCNANGVPDATDILTGTSKDLNHNGIPDECECYPDCDGSATLDLFDFLCFTNAFNNADPYADCDGSATLDLFDFLCFVNAFNTGCS